MLQQMHGICGTVCVGRSEGWNGEQASLKSLAGGPMPEMVPGRATCIIPKAKLDGLIGKRQLKSHKFGKHEVRSEGLRCGSGIPPIRCETAM